MINLPKKCMRGYKRRCFPLAQIVSDEKPKSYICCGIHDGLRCDVEKDRFAVCWKNDQIDEMSYWDERDIKDTISVLEQVLSIDENMG